MATNTLQQEYNFDDISNLTDEVALAYLNYQPRDLNLSFVQNPNTGDIAVKTGSNAVKEQLKNLILTNKFERPFQPGVGSNIRDLLFESNDIITEQLIEDEIRTVIANYQPNANVLDVIVESEREGQGYRIKIIFSVKNEKGPVTFTTFLEATRGT
jgi:phage baseplate assembly protein W|tara:strand:- start:180 stop:647 length:468 start_codon:yes stop_codon:yes gene_type:complete